MSMPDPRDRGYSVPAEWAPHAGVVVAAPHLRDEWGAHFEAARDEWAAMVRALVEVAGDPATVLVANDEAEAFCRRALAGVTQVELVRMPYGDSWTRDTAPIGLVGRGGELGSVRFRFNGWGGKFAMDGDAEVGDLLRARFAGERFERPIVLEGGAIEVDGEGTLLTTEQCLLEPKRNPGLTREALEAELMRSLGVERVLWLRRGLLHDHTDGHVDTLARFVAPGKVVCMAPAGPSDPNREVLEEIASDLARMEDARGRRLEVARIPSPGFVPDDDGAPLPASYCNYYVGNDGVVVPTYGVPSDAAATAGLYALLGGRKVVGRSARAIITGGGAFHCMTQQLPLHVPGEPKR
jgi:agmatine deiminase